MADTAERNTRVVRELYDLAFNQQQPEEAVRKYIGATYRQHNPQAGDGAQPFIGFVKWLTGANPKLRIEFKRSIAQGDLVALHSHMIPAPGARGTAVIDIFRLSDDGKIVEHWDVMQEVPETSANNNTMF
ncbi:MAG: nuclear transport factor 2 family protein [Gemmatimonadaceae bacterium]